MLQTNAVFYAWVKASIKQVLPHVLNLCPENSVALITTIDSSENLNEWSEFKNIKREIEFAFQDNAIKVEINNLQLLTERLPNLFNGFDELWFFEPNTQPHRPGYGLVSPLNIAEDFPKSLAPWLREHNCFLGLGDGIGMNFVTTIREIAEYVESIIVE